MKKGKRGKKMSGLNGLEFRRGENRKNETFFLVARIMKKNNEWDKMAFI
jgi:hypothetical protein